MGIRLIVEIFDHWKEFGLTAGERDDLLVIAENANDQDRETRGPLHEDYILRRANKTSRTWKNAIAKLAKKGALEYVASGCTGRHAVYRIVGLCPEAPHDGWKGYCTRPERVTPQMTQQDDLPQKEGHLSGDPAGEEGHLTDATGSPERCKRVTSQMQEGHLRGDPYPSYPSHPSTPSSYLPSADASSPPTAAEAAEDDGEQHPGPIARSTALVDALDYRDKPPGRSQRDKLSILVARALQAGWTEHDLKAYLDLGQATVRAPAAVYRHRLSPDELPEPPKPKPEGPVLPDWCGTCAGGEPAAATDASLRWIDNPDGSTDPCRRCSLQATRTRAA